MTKNNESNGIITSVSQEEASQILYALQYFFESVSLHQEFRAKDLVHAVQAVGCEAIPRNGMMQKHKNVGPLPKHCIDTQTCAIVEQQICVN